MYYITGKNIRTILKYFKIKRKTLAELLGVSQFTLFKLEYGIISPNINIINILANLCFVSEYDFMISDIRHNVKNKLSTNFYYLSPYERFSDMNADELKYHVRLHKFLSESHNIDSLCFAGKFVEYEQDYFKKDYKELAVDILKRTQELYMNEDISFGKKLDVINSINNFFMKEFNIENLQNKDSKIVTADGKSARIICCNVKSDYPIVAAIMDEDGKEIIKQYNMEGYTDDSYLSKYDLIIL